MITFNTTRLYTEKGQRIAADFTEDGGILFADVDRCVQGYFPPEVVKQYDLALDQSSVMRAYDNQLCSYWSDTYRHEEQLHKLRQAARGL